MVVCVPILLATLLLFHTATALFIKTLFVPLVNVNGSNAPIDCSSTRSLSVGGSVMNLSTTSSEFCSENSDHSIKIVNTIPEQFLPEDSANAYQIELKTNDSVFSAVFSINDTEDETEQLERIELTLKGKFRLMERDSNGTEVKMVIFARFVFTEIQFSDAALIVLSIVAGASLIFIICVLIYITATRLVERRLNSLHVQEGYSNIDENSTQSIVPSPEDNDSITVRERPNSLNPSPEDSVEATGVSEIRLESDNPENPNPAD